MLCIWFESYKTVRDCILNMSTGACVVVMNQQGFPIQIGGYMIYAKKFHQNRESLNLSTLRMLPQPQSRMAPLIFWSGSVWYWRLQSVDLARKSGCRAFKGNMSNPVQPVVPQAIHPCLGVFLWASCWPESTWGWCSAAHTLAEGFPLISLFMGGHFTIKNPFFPKDVDKHWITKYNYKHQRVLEIFQFRFVSKNICYCKRFTIGCWNLHSW